MLIKFLIAMGAIVLVAVAFGAAFAVVGEFCEPWPGDPDDF